MTKFGNLVPIKAQNTKKVLELVMSFLSLPRVFTILMAHHQLEKRNVFLNAYIDPLVKHLMNLKISAETLTYSC